MIQSVPGISPTLMLVGLTGMLALYDYDSPDVFVFLNGQIAQLTGMGIGIVCMSVSLRVTERSVHCAPIIDYII